MDTCYVEGVEGFGAFLERYDPRHTLVSDGQRSMAGNGECSYYSIMAAETLTFDYRLTKRGSIIANER